VCSLVLSQFALQVHKEKEAPFTGVSKFNLSSISHFINFSAPKSATLIRCSTSAQPTVFVAGNRCLNRHDAAIARQHARSV
jgi:hypothetical protein